DLLLCFSSLLFFCGPDANPYLHSFPTRRSSDLLEIVREQVIRRDAMARLLTSLLQEVTGVTPLPIPEGQGVYSCWMFGFSIDRRSEEHTSELQSLRHLVCRLLLEKKKNRIPANP